MQTASMQSPQVARSVVRGSIYGSAGGLGLLKDRYGPKTIRPAFQNLGMYVFLISFACVYYLANTSLMLGHFDLGWHLAAGDLIRERGNVPFQDPWSFTLDDRQWYNLSWLWDVIASVLFQYTSFSGLIFFVVACGAVIVGYLASSA